MDVFIPEDYVTRRRIEKKAAAIARKRSDTVSESSKRLLDKEKSQSPPFRQLDSDFLVSSCLR
ncbi:hypothetical protein Patl1_17734 [Pistacia atlantica]|uniref:Uncharacterized protein n=1 Tax=Pistacia atlantica TaxID=434234 RepID=A0ACC1BYF6_9ROSI|nr:hypothetical protein Patl1_17734 [Pistacia atlantica]